MVGNLIIKFRVAKLVNNAYKEKDMKEHELQLVVGIEHEWCIKSYLEKEMPVLLAEAGFALDDDEAIFNLEYDFDEIVDDEDIESIWLDYDFR